MPTRNDSPGARILGHWDRLSGLPGGRRLFSWILGRIAPYSGTLGAVVEELEPGRARVALRDRRGVRNHLSSVHAVALVNLGELATGLATTTGLPQGVRAIVVELRAEFHAKARGRLVAECRADIPQDLDEARIEVSADVVDRSGTAVATITAVWRTRTR